MYLEISGRQTGKTARLVGIALHHVKYLDQNVIYVVPNIGVARFIFDRFLLFDYKPVFANLGNIKHILGANSGGIYLATADILSKLYEVSAKYARNTTFIYDEFDFFGNVGLRLCKDDFYATTPAFIREQVEDDDVLANLVKMANGHYLNMVSPNADRLIEAGCGESEIRGVWCVDKPIGDQAKEDTAKDTNSGRRNNAFGKSTQCRFLTNGRCDHPKVVEFSSMERRCLHVSHGLNCLHKEILK